jgi:TIR domain
MGGSELLPRKMSIGPYSTGGNFLIWLTKLQAKIEANPSMRRWFLSYNTQDLALMQALEAALRQRDTDAHIFFAPRSLRAGGYWLPELAKEIAQSTAFVLLIGKKGIGQWQVIEYYDAFDRRVKEPDYPVILILQSGQSAPGLPFLHQLHRIVTSDPASEDTVGKLFHAADGTDARPGELWRYTAPYRGLAAMTESDSDFFFGRERETVEAINVLAGKPDKLPILLGNSGVGKSSLAQAGVLAALLRQDYPCMRRTPVPGHRCFTIAVTGAFSRYVPAQNRCGHWSSRLFAPGSSIRPTLNVRSVRTNGLLRSSRVMQPCAGYSTQRRIDCMNWGNTSRPFSSSTSIRAKSCTPVLRKNSAVSSHKSLHTVLAIHACGF